MSELRYKIIEEIAKGDSDDKGWATEVNIVSWNDREPKIDIRKWAPDHAKMSKGITMTENDAAVIAAGILAYLH